MFTAAKKSLYFHPWTLIQLEYHTLEELSLELHAASHDLPLSFLNSFICIIKIILVALLNKTPEHTVGNHI